MLRSRLSHPFTASAASRVVLPATSLLVWGAVAFSVVTWGLRWSATGSDPVSVTSMAQVQSEIDASAVARSLGAAPSKPVAATTLASRFLLQGVLAAESSQGAALIAVDGKPAKPYRVGAVVAEGLMLQSAQGRHVSLGVTLDGPPTLELELPIKR